MAAKKAASTMPAVSGVNGRWSDTASGTAEQVLELADRLRPGRQRRQRRVVDEDATDQTGQQFRCRPTDPPCAHQSDDHLVQRLHRCERGRAGPSIADVVVQRAYSPLQRQEQGDGVGGHLQAAVGRLVDYCHARRLGRSQVYRVEADAGAPDHPDAGGQSGNMRSPQGLKSDYDAERARSGLGQGAGVGEVAEAELDVTETFDETARVTEDALSHHDHRSFPGLVQRDGRERVLSTHRFPPAASAISVGWTTKPGRPSIGRCLQ